MSYSFHKLGRMSTVPTVPDFFASHFDERSQCTRDGFSYICPFRDSYKNALVPKDSAGVLDQPMSSQLSFNSESSLCVSSENAKMAGVKIFATIMLNAWRRRRKACKIMSTELEELKSSSTKIKNELQVTSTLYQNEQKRSNELFFKLKRSLTSMDEAKSSCESLTTSLISLKADHAVLEEELRTKKQEYERMAQMLDESKAEYYKVIVEQAKLRESLEDTRRCKLLIENQKNKLMTEIFELHEESRKLDEKFRIQLNKQSVELSAAKGRESQLLKDIDLWKERLLNATVQRTEEELVLRREVKDLRLRGNSLQQELDKSFSFQVRELWKKCNGFQRKLMGLAHVATFCLLPAMPEPRAFSFKGTRH